jgi:carbon-monoxide dehydrogenase medium subunit
MLLPKFDYHQPQTLAETCEILDHYRERARPLAGGTDLLVNLKKKLLRADHLVSLNRVAELEGIEKSDGRLRIGAAALVAEIAESSEVQAVAPALVDSAGALGTPLIRNRATIGGNIGSARPAADLPPTLMAYDATLVLQNGAGRREMPVGEFFKGPGLSCIEPDELIVEIWISIPPGPIGAGYLNLGVRKSQDCNIVNVASYLALDPSEKTIESARVVMGSVGPTPLRSASAEALLVGAAPDPELFEQAGRAATADCTPILDFRGSSEYRRAMVSVLTRRTLGIALERIRKKQV